MIVIQINVRQTEAVPTLIVVQVLVTRERVSKSQLSHKRRNDTPGLTG